jgi:hypothetical protein
MPSRSSRLGLSLLLARLRPVFPLLLLCTFGRALCFGQANNVHRRRHGRNVSVVASQWREIGPLGVRQPHLRCGFCVFQRLHDFVGLLLQLRLQALLHRSEAIGGAAAGNGHRRANLGLLLILDGLDQLADDFDEQGQELADGQMKLALRLTLACACED